MCLITTWKPNPTKMSSIYLFYILDFVDIFHPFVILLKHKNQMTSKCNLSFTLNNYIVYLPFCFGNL